MRALALFVGLGILVSGCLSAGTLDPAVGTLPPLPVSVHRDGLPVLDATAQQVLGSAPRVVQKLLGTRGAEPNIGVTSSGAAFVSSGDLVMRTTDRGATWEQVYEFGAVHPPAALPVVGMDPVRNTDPMLWVDPTTDRIFAPAMWPPLGCASGATSDDDGETWQGLPLACGLPGLDHQKVVTGPYVEGSQLPRTGDYPNVVYFCYNDVKNGPSTRCAVSSDGGRSYPIDLEAAGAAQCGGVNGHPAAAPDGTVYVPLGWFCGEPMVAVSDDNGLSWTVRKLHVGGLGEAEIDPEVAVTADGTAYYFWRALSDHRMYVVRSTDGFETISRPMLVSPPDVTSTRFAAMSAGDDGKLAFAYLGTRDVASRAGDAYDDTRWHLFTTFTTDATAAAPTFVTVQVTPHEDPIQIGYQWESGGGDPARNLLDYIDGVVDGEGRFWVALTDGCTDECAYNSTATKAQSRARNTSIAVLEEGPLLRAAPLPAPGAARPAALMALPRLR